MNAKYLTALLIVINCYTSCVAALRRTPKVYNALITTDENLTSSRAYPVIQPTIHETGYAHYPYGPYNPYHGFYNHPLVRFGQPIAPGLVQRGQQLPYPMSQHQFPPQVIRQHQSPQPQPFPGYPLPQNLPTAPSAPEVQPNAEPSEPTPVEQQQPVQPPTTLPQELTPGNMLLDPNRPQQMPNQKLPLPLNQFGLPPALIPLQQYPNRNGHPIHLPPYGYNQYPLIYDPITGYRNQFLPPYEYYPSHTYAVGPEPGRKPQPQPLQPTAAPMPTPTEPSSIDEDTETTADLENAPATVATETNFERIKNVSKSKNSAVPDVPPPPIPSGAKAKQS